MTAMPHAFIGEGEACTQQYGFAPTVRSLARSLAHSLTLALPEQSAHRRSPRQRWRDGLAPHDDDSDRSERREGKEGGQ